MIQTGINIGHLRPIFFEHLVWLIFIAITNISAGCPSDEYPIMHHECCPNCQTGKSEIPPRLINIDIYIYWFLAKHIRSNSVPQANMFLRTVLWESTQCVCRVAKVLSTMDRMGLNNAFLAQTVLQVLSPSLYFNTSSDNFCVPSGFSVTALRLAGLGFKLKKQCTTTSDALCEVLDGYFCKDSVRGGCIAVQRHKDCSPGQYISQRGWCPTMCAWISKLNHC